MKKSNILIFIISFVLMLNVNVFATEYGDVDGSGELTAADAAYTLAKALNSNFILTVKESIADVDCDGGITAGDATIILQKVLSNAFIMPIEDKENTTETTTEITTETTTEVITENTTEATTEDTNDKSILIAYFSCTGSTRGIAEAIAEILGADIYEIVPQQPYTAEDLNYQNSQSRANVEQNDLNARPAILGSVENIQQYDIVFIGYPIWWGDAPKIISTFLESYNFSGKTIVPFCTSGSSSIGSSARDIEGLTDGANWISGRRFARTTSSDIIKEWINGLGLEITIQ